MVYKRDPNITYTEMCIYIDEHAYQPHHDENLIYEYLYHIAVMLAQKGRFFLNERYYDDYGIFAATSAFMRLHNPKQFELDEDGNPLMKPIKSILNYLKNVSYPLKVDFQQREFCQHLPNEDEYKHELIANDLRSQMMDSIDQLTSVEFSCCLHDIIKSIRAYLVDIPYYNDVVVWNNVYTSVLLSFLSSVTLSNVNKQKLQDLGKAIYSKPNVLEQLYQQESENSTILYHLDASFKDYITLLTKKVKHLIARDLSEILRVNMPSETEIQSLIFSSIDTYGEEQ